MDRTTGLSGPSRHTTGIIGARAVAADPGSSVPGPIRTERLDLVPATSATLAADEGDRRGLGRLLNASIPAGWPPPLVDEATHAEFVRRQADGSDKNFRVWFWILSGQGEEGRVLIGSGGTASHPAAPDTVMIGYSVIDEFQGRGYASEAVRNLIPVIFRFPGIRMISATTYPSLKASIRVLEKNHFTPAGASPCGSGMEEGTLAFVLRKPGAACSPPS